MDSPNPFYLANAATSKYSCPLDGLAGKAKGDNPLMGLSVRSATRVFASRAGKLDSLILPLSTGLIIIPCNLQGNSKEQFLHGFQDNLRDSVGASSQIG